MNKKAGKNNVEHLGCTENSRALLPNGQNILPSKVIKYSKLNAFADCIMPMAQHMALKNNDRSRYHETCPSRMGLSDTCKVPPILIFKKKFDLRYSVNHSLHDYDLASVPWQALLLVQSQIKDCCAQVRKLIVLII